MRHHAACANLVPKILFETLTSISYQRKVAPAPAAEPAWGPTLTSSKKADDLFVVVTDYFPYLKAKQPYLIFSVSAGAGPFWWGPAGPGPMGHP